MSGEILVHYSRLYRSTLHECVLGLTKPDHSAYTCHMTMTPPTDPPTPIGAQVWEEGGMDEKWRKQLGCYYVMLELAWHLCEVLFIELLPAGCLIQQLLEWIQRNTSEHSPSNSNHKFTSLSAGFL